MCTLSGSTNDEENKNKGKPNHLCELVSPWWWDTGMAAGAWGAGGQAGPPSACLSLCSLAFQASQQDAHSHKLVLQAEQQMLGPSPRHVGQWEPPAAPAVLAPHHNQVPLQHCDGHAGARLLGVGGWSCGARSAQGVLFSSPPSFVAHPPVGILWEEGLSSPEGWWSAVLHHLSVPPAAWAEAGGVRTPAAEHLSLSERCLF